MADRWPMFLRVLSGPLGTMRMVIGLVDAGTMLVPVVRLRLCDTTITMATMAMIGARLIVGTGK
jgi:hypothetical protein